MTRSGARVVPALGTLCLLAPLAATTQPPAVLNGANQPDSGPYVGLKLKGK